MDRLEEPPGGLATRHGSAVVTGAASGIGLALARGLTGRGQRVLLIDTHAARLAEAASTLPGSVALTVDVGDEAAMADAAERAQVELGPASVVCANAGIAGPTGARLWELADAEWERVFRVDFYGVLHTLHAFLPQMLEAGGGRLVVTASMAGLTDAPAMPAYYAAKHALVSMCQTLRLQLERDRLPVTISVLCPSTVRTNLGETHDDDFDARTMPPSSGTAITAEEAAAATLDAMDDGKFFVFTHADSRARVDRVQALIAEAFARAAF